MSRSAVFACAESAEHVKEANIKYQDIVDSLQFYIHFNVPTDKAPSWYIKQALIFKDNSNKLHDLAHQLIDNLVIQYDMGHPVLTDTLFTEVIKELREKQKQCRGGHKHE